MIASHLRKAAQRLRERRFTGQLLWWAILLVAVVASLEPNHGSRPLNAWLAELDSADARERERARLAVRQMGRPVIPHLLSRLESHDETVRERGVLGFEALGAEARSSRPALVALLRQERASLSAARALAMLGPEAVPVLTKELDAPVRFVRNHAALALGQIRPAAAAAVPRLIGALRDRDMEFRRCAVSALGELAREPKRTVPALAACLEDESAVIRRMAALALARFGPAAAPAIPALHRAICDSDTEVKLAASAAIHQIAPDVAP